MELKKITPILLLIAALAALPFPLQGQQSIKASGKVKGSVNYITSQDMDFGEMDPAASTVTDRVVSLLSVVQDAIAGNAGTLDYRLNKDGTGFTFAMPGTLASTTSSSTLAVNAWECGLEVGTTPNSVSDPGSTAALDDYDSGGSCASQLTADLSGENGSRLVRLYIGGTIAASAFEAAPAETFEADITITVILP